MEGGLLEDLEHVQAEVEGHQLREAEGDGDLVLDRVEDGPEVFPFHPFLVDGKSCHLERFEVPVEGPRVALQLVGQL